jgi:hypothetical protein
LAATVGGAARAGSDAAALPIRIEVAATKGEIIPQSKGGGGFQRSFQFTAVPGRANRWIMQVLEVRGTVFDAEGRETPAHLDVVEYYRVASSGCAIQLDSHYSQFWDYCGGTLAVTSRLTYGTLQPRREGDRIVGRSFILRSAADATGRSVTMRTRTTRQPITAENGERVEFRPDAASLPTRYTYRVRWDVRGSRTQPSGGIDAGTWWIEVPEETGPTEARARPRPIPLLKTGA